MRRILPFVLLLPLLLLSSYASAQTITVGMWEDGNGNGLDDDGIPIILSSPNLPELYSDADGNGMIDGPGDLIATSTSLMDGFYEFTGIAAGDYIVLFPPAGGGLIPTRYDNEDPPTLADNNSNIQDDPLMRFDNGTYNGYSTLAFNFDGVSAEINVDAGFILPVNIGDMVFEDMNGDGFSTGDPGIANVEVRLINNTTGVNEMTDAFGAPLTNPVLTDGAGLYQFANVFPGDYTVRFTNLQVGANGEAFYLTTPDAGGQAGSPGDDDSDATSVGGSTLEGEVNLGVVSSGSIDEETRVDAGYFAPVTIGDFVFHDINSDGIQNDGGVAPPDDFDVEITDLPGNPVNDATGAPLNPVTAFGGNYQFNLVPPGDYVVKFVKPAPGGAFDNYLFSPLDVPGGTNDATDTGDDSDADLTTGDTHLITVMSSETDEEMRIDAGAIACVKIGGDFWTDDNGNGIQDGGELALDGVSLRLIDNNTGSQAISCDGVNNVPDQTTGSGPFGPGSYEFDNVPPGDYFVEVLALPNVTDVMTLQDATGAIGPDGTTDSDFGTVVPFQTDVFTVESGDTDEETRVDGGVVSPVEIGDMVWHDENGNGIQDGGEPGLDNIEVTIARTDGNPLLDIFGAAYPTPTVVTAGGGMYLFDNLPSGAYTLTFSSAVSEPDFYLTTADYSGLTGAADATDDSDAIPNAGNQTGSVDVVTIVDGSNPLGTETMRVDAGFFNPVSIGDMVWHDLDLDGTQNEAPLDGVAGITVTLFDVNTGAALTTDAAGFGLANPFVTPGSGMYSFDLVPPGDYYVEFSGAGGDWYLTPMSDVSGAGPLGTDDSDAVFVAGTWQSGQTTNFTVWSENTANWEDNEMRIDAGFYDPSSIGDMVWHDLNGNGLQDDAPLGGPTDEFDVELDAVGPSTAGAPTPTDDAEGNPLPKITTTAGGMYSFDLLKPGMYRVTFVKPAAAAPPYFFTIQDATGGVDEASDVPDDSDADDMTGESHDINLESREDVLGAPPEDERIDAGVYRCAIIGGNFWADANGDGIQDGTEGAVAGVEVALLYVDPATGGQGPATDCDGNVVGNEITDGAGEYEFINLPPGSYFVEVIDLGDPTRSLTMVDNYSGGNTDATDPNDDSDFPVATMISHEIILLSEEIDEEERIDGGIIQPASIEIFVWHDSNADGQYQNPGDECGEDPLDMGEATFTLTLNGAPAMDADGNPIVVNNLGGGIYSIPNLAPGTNYQLTANAAGWEFTLPHFDGSTTDPGDGEDDSDFDAAGTSPVFELLAGSPKTNIDLGLWKFMTVGGYVWIQNNDLDGTFDPPDDQKAPNVIVNIYADLDMDGFPEALVGSATTDADGNYMFMNLPPGDYRIELDKNNFGVPLSPLEVFMPLSTVFDPNDDKDGQNDGMGFNAEGGVEATPVKLRCGCEPGPDGLENKTIDIGVFFEFDCSETNQDYLAFNCDDTDPTNPGYNPFFPICDLFILDNFCATMTDIQTMAGPSPLCANGGVPHNISWFSFVAGDGVYDLVVTPGNCQAVGGGLGIQNGIYTDCTFGEEIQCQGLPCSTAPITLSNTDANGNVVLIPGEVYHWFLDGCSGSVCEFEIDVVGNFIPFEPQPPTDLICNGGGLAPDCTGEFCPGETVNFLLEGIEIENINYTWSVTPDDGGWVADVPDPSLPTLVTFFNNIDITFDPDLMPGETRVYTVCWENLNAKCYSLTGPLCKDITVRRLANEDFGVVELCELDLFSFTGPTEDETGNPDPNGDGISGWQNTNYIFTEGEHCLDVVLPNGCEYEECVEIVVKQTPPNARVDTVFCDGELPGVVFGSSLAAQNEVITDILLGNENPPIFAANGCDTIIDLYVWYMFIDGTLTGDCGVDQFGNTVYNLTFNEDLAMTQDAGTETVYTYNWYRTAFGVGPGFELTDGDPDMDPYTFQASEAGQWELHITMTVNDQDTGLPISGCTYIFTVDVDPESFLPPNPVPGPWNLAPCAVGSPPIDYTITSGPDETPTWIWPSDVAGANGQGTDTLTIDWTGSAGGEIGVFVSNQCGNSDTIFQTVTLITVPDPEIAIDLDTTCVDSLFTITSVGPVIGGEVYTWTFSGGVVQGGTAMGPGPHVVSWPNVGPHEVTLQVNIGDCVSTIARDTVFTVPPIVTPVITCAGSTINSASFSWNPVAGATGYIVEVVQGPSSNTGGFQTETTFTMNDMALGEGAIIRVTALTDNPCGPTVGTSLECFAQNCPPDVVTISADPDTICFASDLTPVPINISWSGATPPGSGEFSGPGISDPTMAIFDPIAAGVGTHSIIYTFSGSGPDYGNCVYNAQMTFVIFQTPTSDFTIGGDDICIDQQSTITYTGNTTNGTYNWTVDPSEVMLDGIGPFTVDWPTAGDKTVTLTVERNGCISDPTTLNVSVDDLVGQVDLTCVETSATSVTFGWNATANTSAYDVIVDGVPVGTQAETTFIQGGLIPGDEVEIIVTALSDNLCGNTTDTITCIAQNCPAFTLTVPSDTTLCSDATAFDLNWSIEGGLQDGSGIGYWRGPGIIDSVAGTFDPQVSGTGNFRIFLEYVEGPAGACPGQDFLDISVIDVPVVSFTISDDTICLSERIDITYTGTPPSLDPMVNVTGGSLEVSPNGRIFRWTFDTPGTYTFEAEAFVGSCIGTPMSATVVVLDEPMETVEIRCDGADLDFVRFAWNDLDCADEYEVFIDGVSVGIQPETTYEVTGLDEGDMVDIRVVPINICECATLTEGELTCTATACPPIAVSIAASQNEICIDDTPGTTIPITATITGQNGGGTEFWSGQGVDDNGVFTPAGLSVGDYLITYRYEEQDGNCSDEATTTITIHPNPVGLVSPVDPVCFDNNVGSVGIGSGIDGAVYDLTLNGSPLDSANVDGLVPGGYTVVFTDPANGCQSTETFTITAAPLVVAEIVGDMVILKGENTTLRVEYTPPNQNVDSIAWTNTTTGEFIPCPDPECTSITISPELDAEYCAELFYNDGCVIDACAMVRVNEDPDITIPNIFNPTENSNPSFYVPHNGQFVMVQKMLIYDRWGSLVYAAEDIMPEELEARGWDGTHKGQLVNPGVFVYLIEIVDLDPNTGEVKEQPDIYTGDVTVLR